MVVATPFLVLTVYLGIYAFKNPDQPAWYGIDSDGSMALYATEKDANVSGALLLVDIHRRFHIWFLWGFSLAVAPCAALIIFPIFSCIPILGNFLISILSFGMCCGWFAWWIVGILWRFRAMGQFSVGDIPANGIMPEDWAD